MNHIRNQSADIQAVPKTGQQDYEFIQLTQINAPTNVDVSAQSNTLNEIQAALVQPNNDCVQTSFSHLYQPYPHTQKNEAPAELNLQN